MVQMLRPWQFNIVLDRGMRTSVSQQIVHSVIEEIRRGRLRPGTPLPGSRELGERLGLNRKTVIQSYAELEAQGWVRSETRRGTFVAENLPQLDLPEGGRPDRSRMPSEPFFAPARMAASLSAELPEHGMLSFDDGAPDIRHVPADALARAYRNALRSTLRHRRLGYGDPRGSEQLRAAVSTMLNSDRGLATATENICLTRGSQMAIFVVAQTLVVPGDTVVVERLSYPPAREAFRRAGAAIASVGVDAQGLDVDGLERACRKHRVRAVYVTPHHHFPTTVLMTPERRMRLMLLAAQFGFAVVEDDYDHEFHFTHQPMLPLASFDGGGHVIYVGSLSKLLSPSLRLGYVSAPTSLIERIAGEIMLVDRQGDPATEGAVAELIEDGELHRHTRKMMRLYADRRTHFAQQLQDIAGSRVAFDMPEGGLAFWVKFAGVDVLRLREECRERNLFVQSPRPFAADGADVGALRLGFASLDVDEITAATHRLVAALDRVAEA
jgi:GntR family transcriptional regulator/MocR family aminotransferase